MAPENCQENMVGNYITVSWMCFWNRKKILGKKKKKDQLQVAEI
jgi:hypothetical protein